MKHRKRRRTVASMRKPHKHPQGDGHKSPQEQRADIAAREQKPTAKGMTSES